MDIQSWKIENPFQEAHEMRQDTLRTPPRLVGGIAVILLCAACITGTQAADYRFGYPNRHYYPNDIDGLHDNFGLRQDMNRLSDQMQRQQRQLQEQVRQQQEQTRLLRQQQSAQQQLTAMQACYYRFNGGLDLCDRLFDAASKKHAACVETAVEMNPGCAGDIARPVRKSGD
jgi:uncharacterized protein HemX